MDMAVEQPQSQPQPPSPPQQQSKPRKPGIRLPDDKKMEIGRAIASGLRPSQAEKHFRVSKNVVYSALRHYEAQTGERLIGMSTVEKSQLKKSGIVFHEPKPAQHLTTTGGDWQARALTAEAQLRETKAALEHAEDEAHTLQKIIMVLGRNL